MAKPELLEDEIGRKLAEAERTGDQRRLAELEQKIALRLEALRTSASL